MAIKRIAALAGRTVVQMINGKSTAFRDMNVDLSSLTEEKALSLIQENPRIMFRPVLLDGKSAVVGFDPAQMERLLS
jgi:regulatory protein spx